MEGDNRCAKATWSFVQPSVERRDRAKHCDRSGGSRLDSPVNLTGETDAVKIAARRHYAKATVMGDLGDPAAEPFC